jgi:hypothetical protein
VPAADGKIVYRKRARLNRRQEVPHEANRKVHLLRARIQAALRTAGDLPYVAGYLVLLEAYLIMRKR